MRRLLKYLRARSFERDLASEMEAHLDEKIERLTQEEGLPPEEARRRAIREFGNRTLLAESCRHHWAFPWFDELVQNFRFAFRLLRKSPMLTVVAVVTLALGIGSNTTVFSAVSHVLLRALPYSNSDRLFALWSRSAARGGAIMHVSAADFYDWREQSRAFESLAAHASWPMNLTGVEQPARLET